MRNEIKKEKDTEPRRQGLLHRREVKRFPTVLGKESPRKSDVQQTWEAASPDGSRRREGTRIYIFRKK